MVISKIVDNDQNRDLIKELESFKISFTHYQKRNFTTNSNTKPNRRLSLFKPQGIRNFSSTNGKNKYSWLISSLDSESYDILPCINGKTKTKFNKSLKSSLCSIITDKSISYKLEYFLYLHTNDENKELIKGVPIYDSVLDNKYSNQVMNHIFALTYLENLYEYKGYAVVHTDIYDPKLFLNMDSYVNNVYYILQKYVIYINEEALEIEEFIEFKKSTILKITVINKSNNLD